MATYFVSKDGNGTGGTTDPGTSGSWSVALATLGAAITAATSDGDVIKVSDEHFETLGADTTYTIAVPTGGLLKIICVDHNDTSVASAMDYTNSYIGNKGTNRAIVFNATFPYYCYIYGMCFVVGATTNTDVLRFGGVGAHFDIDACYFEIGNGGLWVGAGDRQTAVRIRNTTINNVHASGTIEVDGGLEMVGVTLTGTAPTNLFEYGGATDTPGAWVRCVGCDFSTATNYLFGHGSAYNNTPTAQLSQCKLGSGVVILNSLTSKGLAGWNVFLHDCNAGDVHYSFHYEDVLGSVSTSTAIYANDGAEYNTSGDKTSWVIIPKSEANIYHPFITPWISAHFEPAGTPAAITPTVEIVRSGSSTAFQNDEIWSEWAFKGTSGVPLASFNDSDMLATPLSTPANQATGALDASGWTGENATSWFGKLGPASSITPQEIGDISVRFGATYIGAGTENYIYVDPQIRGLS